MIYILAIICILLVVLTTRIRSNQARSRHQARLLEDAWIAERDRHDAKFGITRDKDGYWI